jgi:atypical dual specificity phosphatase
VKLFSTVTPRCLSIQSSNQICSVPSGEESSELSHIVINRCLSLSIQSSNEHSSVTSDEESSEASFGELETDGYASEFDTEHFVLPRCRSMVSRSTSPTGCCDAVFVTEADLEGYETYADTGNDAISVDVVFRHKPIMQKLSCLLGSLKLTGSCEPPPSRLTEVRAC